MRKWIARCPAVGALSATVVFCLALVVSVFSSCLTWNVRSWLRRAQTPWSCRKEEGAWSTHVAEGGRPGGAGIDSRADAWSRPLELAVVQVSRPSTVL